MIMAKKPEVIEQATRLLFVCKFLERIGDHTTNICEWTVYLLSGKKIDLNE
jgi:phosphate transport system protein